MNNVWYASYGSNMMNDRFLAYIVGGLAPNSTVPEIGCRDQSLPRRNEKITIPFPLYFAKERSKWGRGGVAFIGTEETNKENTIGRMYLITEEQFLDVVSQENNGMDVAIDLKEVEERGFVDLQTGWYNRIVFLGKKNDAPIFTFTNSSPISAIAFHKPSTAYLSVIAKGLLELGFTREEIITYFLDKKGLEGELSRQRLIERLNEGVGEEKWS